MQALSGKPASRMGRLIAASDRRASMVNDRTMTTMVVAATANDRCATMANHDYLYHWIRHVGTHVSCRGCLCTYREAAQKQGACAKKYFHFSLSQMGHPVLNDRDRGLTIVTP